MSSQPFEYLSMSIYYMWGFPGGASVEEPSGQRWRCKRLRFDPWVRTAPWKRNGNPLQYSCLENPMDGGAWQITVHWMAELAMTEAT